MAAIGLGKHDWAYWDLMLAAKLEPGNREVHTKLDEIQSSQCKEKSKAHPQDDDIPKGLSLGLSSPNKKVKVSLDKKDSSEKEFVLGVNDENEAHGVCATKALGLHNCSYLKGENTSMLEIKNEVRQERMDDGKNILVAYDSSAVGMKQNVGSEPPRPPNKVNSTFERPRIQVSPKSPCSSGYVTYSNRHRSSLFLNISREDMEKLQQGKVLHYHSHLRSMSIRTSDHKKTIKKEAPHKQDLREAEISPAVTSVENVTQQPYSMSHSGYKQDQDRVDKLEDVPIIEVTQHTSCYADQIAGSKQTGHGSLAKRKAAKETRMRALRIVRCNMRKSLPSANVRSFSSRSSRKPRFSSHQCVGSPSLYRVRCKRKSKSSIPCDVSPPPFKKFGPTVVFNNVCSRFSVSTHVMMSHHSSVIMG